MCCRAAVAEEEPALTAAEDAVPEPPDGFSDFTCHYEMLTAEGVKSENAEVDSWEEAYKLVREGSITASGLCI